MTLRFEPDDAEAFYVARDDLANRFERTPAGRDLGWVASGLSPQRELRASRGS
ncbi:MAG: hypothetical protein U9O63_06585 [Actinomycetota bacterium]|nr:hypothetical protein [Actinomycetota bacterium]